MYEIPEASNVLKSTKNTMDRLGSMEITPVTKNIGTYELVYTMLFSGVLVADKCPLVLGKEGARILAMENPEFTHSETATALAERPALALLLKKMPDREGNVIGKLNGL